MGSGEVRAYNGAQVIEDDTLKVIDEEITHHFWQRNIEEFMSNHSDDGSGVFVALLVDWIHEGRVDRLEAARLLASMNSKQTGK